MNTEAYSVLNGTAVLSEATPTALNRSTVSMFALVTPVVLMARTFCLNIPLALKLPAFDRESGLTRAAFFAHTSSGSYTARLLLSSRQVG